MATTFSAGKAKNRAGVVRATRRGADSATRMENERRFEVLVVEDMLPARQLLEEYISARGELRLAGVAKNGEEALELLSKTDYDLVFLDIHLPLVSGLEVIERMARHPYIIFTTAYDQYAIKAFEIGAIDYLLKPISPDRFAVAVDRFVSLRRSGAAPRVPLGEVCLTFRENRTSCIVPFDEIIYLTSSAKHTIIRTRERDFEAASLMGEMEGRLPPRLFLRVHRQHIVNVAFIARLRHESGGHYSLILSDDDDSVVPVGRAFVAAVKGYLGG